MATNRPVKPHRTLLEEAADPATDPERLRELANINGGVEVQRAAWRNPSLPEDLWREVLLEGYPEAWANPMAPLYVLTWTPRQDKPSDLESGARWAAYALWEDPGRCSPEGKALLASKLTEWWTTSQSPTQMMMLLGWWAQKGDGSVEHLEVVRITVLCVRMAPDLTDEDRRALDILEAWATGGEDRRNEARDLPSSIAVKNAWRVAVDSSTGPSFTIYELLRCLASREEPQRLLADVIRREMPLPPVVT
jgi:hypothetical protein